MDKENQELIGKKFNQLTIIKIESSYIYVHPKTNKQSHKKRILCQCDCGEKLIIRLNSVKTGKTKTCQGCAYRLRPQSVRRLTSLQRWFNLHIFSRTKQGIAVKITPEEAYLVASNNCYYCNKEPYSQEIYTGKFSKKEQIIANGIDRIDSNGEYTIDNIVSCCPRCNYMKSDQTVKQFIEKVEKIYYNMKDKAKYE